ncbi:hypothetical protein, partial [Buttiauxella gaviniae]|uniref:hypothetical protein n=1 Tax=Buttiauxella gaviniae TaxID=82990 RepID=UPI001AE06797
IPYDLLTRLKALYINTPLYCWEAILWQGDVVTLRARSLLPIDRSTDEKHRLELKAKKRPT